MMSGSRHVSRPRPSLSCETCRRRKVRCGKEQPKCTSCQRIGEHCEYSHNTYRDKSNSIKSSKAYPGHEMQQDKWSMEPPSTCAPFTTDSMEASEAPAPSPFFPTPSFNDSEEVTKMSNNGSAPATPGVNPNALTQSQMQEWRNAMAATQTWPTALSRSIQQPTPSHTPSRGLRDDAILQAPPPKRHQTYSETKPQLDAMSIDLTSGDALTRPRGPSSIALQESKHANMSGSKENELHTGYMGVGNGTRPRYVESTFWALVNGQESFCEKLLDDLHGPSNTKALWTVAVDLLKGIPAKPVSDVLLYSFLVGVRPIHPIIHLPTFRKDYNAFWHWCKHSDSVTPNQRLIDDPTFIPLLFSVLYSGAVAAPSSLWKGAQPLIGLDKETIVERLRNAYLNGLEHCQYTRRPTLNTLVASLLGRSCSKPNDDQFENIAFVGTVVRIAQSMGLHRERAPSGLDPLTHEMHRRIWWHIICLDNQYSFQYGTQTFCGTEGTQWDVQMVSEASDEAISDFQLRYFASVPIPSQIATSTLMLFAIGRYEATRLMHGLLNRINSCHRVTQADLDIFLNSYKNLHGKLNALVNRMPAQGIPEKGFVPSRLANASMLTHESLYADQSDEPSVFSSWARITLTMLSTGTLINLQKIFLNHPDLTPERREKLWTNTVQLSIHFLSHLIQIYRVPAFAPYLWFFSTNLPPSQAVLVILLYLKQNSTYQNGQIARYFVDEAIEVFESPSPGTGPGSHARETPERPVEPKKEQAPAVWRMLKTMRAELDAPQDSSPPEYLQLVIGNRAPTSTDSRVSASPGASLSRGALSASASTSSISQLTPQTNSSRAFSTGSASIGMNNNAALSLLPGSTGSATTGPSTPEPELGLDISDLDTWSSIVMQDSEDFPMTGYMQSGKLTLGLGGDGFDFDALR